MALDFIQRAIDYARNVINHITSVLSGSPSPRPQPFDESNFNPLDPSTFTASKTNQTSNFAYRVQVNPKDPATYQGVPFITVSSSQLLTEDQIIALASLYVSQYSKFGGLSAIDSLDLVGAQFNAFAQGGF